MPLYDIRETGFSILEGKHLIGKFIDHTSYHDFDLIDVYNDGSILKRNKLLYIVPDENTSIWLTSGGQVEYDKIVGKCTV